MKPVVLVTRPAGTADKVNTLLTERGFQPLACPLLRLTPIYPQAPVDRFDALIFTSANAVRAWLSLNNADSTPVYVVGTETASFARAQGFWRVICGGETIAELLTFLKNDSQTRWLTYLNPCGQHTSLNLAAVPGLNIQCVPLYASVFVPVPPEIILRLQQGGIPWILLFSRRSTESFVASMQHLQQPSWIAATHMACLSAKVAEPLRDIAGVKTAIAAHPTTMSLLDCLEPR